MTFSAILITGFLITGLPAPEILAGKAESGADVAVAVMGGAQQPEIVRLGRAAAGIRHDVIDLQQVLRAAAAPAGAVHVAAAARSRRQTSRLTAAGMVRPVKPPAFAAEVSVRGAAADFAQAVAAGRSRRRVFAAEVASVAGFAAEVSGRSAASSPGCAGA